MDTKTLIIGLGGSGLRILESLSKEDRDNCICMGFDTEIHELHYYAKKMPQVHMISLAPNMRAVDRLALDDNARETWFPINERLLQDPFPSRALTRLALHTSIRMGKLQEFETILQTEHIGKVILTGSLCGYTGSALFLPLSLYIRHVRKDASICGLFLLPEVLEHIYRSSVEWEYARSNAYAVMKELNAFTAEEAGVLQKKYDISLTLPRYQSREDDAYRGRPLDLCFLMGADRAPNTSMTDTMEAAAHGIENLLHESISALGNRLGAQGTCRCSVIDSSGSMTVCRKLKELPDFAENGSYTQAYRRITAELDTSRVLGCALTPHLDRRWHDPAFFPDLDES